MPEDAVPAVFVAATVAPDASPPAYSPPTASPLVVPPTASWYVAPEVTSDEE